MNNSQGKVPTVVTSRDPLSWRRTSLQIMMLLATTFCAATGCSGDKAAPPSPAKPPHVVFYAEGDGTTTGAVTLRSESGGVLQKDVKLPMADEMTGALGTSSDQFKRGAHLYMSLQNKEAAGKVTCRIEVDGKVIDQAISEGPYKVAACTGTVP